MKKSELISVLAKHADVGKTEAERVLAALEQAVKVELLEGGEVTLPGIGTLGTAQRAARYGRNPKTGETIAIPAIRAPKFKPAKGLKDLLKG